MREEHVDWSARSDAFTLAEAEKIKNDKERLRKAQVEAKKVAEDIERSERETLRDMKKVANLNSSKKTKEDKPSTKDNRVRPNTINNAKSVNNAVHNIKENPQVQMNLFPTKPVF